MNFIETRGNNGSRASEVTFSQAILNPSASFGGLYVPKYIPKIDEDFFKDNIDNSYKQLALNLLGMFEIDIDIDDINKALDLYDNFDDKNNPAPVVKLSDDLFVSELYHGPTRAFKDMALQPFGSILSSLTKKMDVNYLILAATSGDTGPAALDTFRNKDGVKVVCLYPDGGTSEVQKLQMVTENGKNLKVLGINGNFDDAQNALKKLLASDEFKTKLEKFNIKLTAANSVNFGRIIFQIIYHFSAYLQLLKCNDIISGENINLVVPSGNFGNALGAFYAKKMGLPIDKIVIASNENNVLTSFIEDGLYDLRNRNIKITLSPAMDILKSSNIERILNFMFGSSRTKELMENLSSDNYFQLSLKETEEIKKDFVAVYSDDLFGKKTIKSYLDNGYCLDPHTATCIKGYEHINTINDKKTVIYSTAEWTKFSPTLVNSINCDDKSYSDRESLDIVSNKYNIDIPNSINDIFNMEILHKDVIDIDKLEVSIFEFLELQK